MRAGVWREVEATARRRLVRVDRPRVPRFGRCPPVAMDDVEAGLHVVVCQGPPRTGRVLSSAGLAELVEHLGVSELLLGRDDRAVVRRQRGDQRADQLVLLSASRAAWLGLCLRAARPSLPREEGARGCMRCARVRRA